MHGVMLDVKASDTIDNVKAIIRHLYGTQQGKQFLVRETVAVPAGEELIVPG